MNAFKRLSLCLTVVLATLAVQSCVVATKTTIITPEIIALYKGKFKIDPYMQEHMPRTVAVLPFYDLSKSGKGFDAVRKGFYNHFSAVPYQDMELYKVDALLAKAGLTDPDILYKTPYEELGKILGVDAIVLGEISDFDKLFAILYSHVAVGAEVRMYDAKTGHFLWSGKHTVRIHEGGVSTTPIGIIATIVATSLNMRDIQLLRACDDLFRDMVKTIPAPSLAEALRPPTITLLTQDTKGLPKKAGDEVRIVIQGTPKMRARFDIGDYRRRIDMQEIEPGGYPGVYKVLPGDNVQKATITGYLEDDARNMAQWVDAVGSVTLDTTPPDIPKNYKSVGRNGLVLLNWEKSVAPDLVGYRLYRSETPLTGFTEIARTELNEHRDAGLTNDRKYYFQISSVDQAGNESERSEVIVGMPVTPGPTPVSGAIEADTIWYSGASPYVIENSVIVRDKARLTIEPGTEIRSGRGGITVEGRLLAQGDGEHIITFDAEEGKTWEGITFLNVKEKENVLRNVRIRKARIGVLCMAASPRIEASEFVENGTAVRISGAFSKPNLVQNTLHRQKEAAVVVEAGAQPLLAENRIRDNEGKGIVVQASSPVITRNVIAQNRGVGIDLKTSPARISENNLTDNRPFDMTAEMTGEAVNASGNWWGTAQGLEVLKKIRGRVDVATVLSAAYPDGKPVALPILSQTLDGAITADGFLTVSNSPYRVQKDVTVDGGATLYVEPGVEIRFDQNTSLIMADGGIVAKGTPDRPIVFTASGTTPAPGFYTNAVRFTKKTKVNSALAYCEVKFASTALDVYTGAPEISHCLIAQTSQGGIFCRNDAAPRISYSTFTANAGEGAIKSVGMSNPSIHRNNFIDNPVALQIFSSIYIDARENWWGKAPPDVSLIWGDLDRNINIKPWLEKPEDRAFRGR